MCFQMLQVTEECNIRGCYLLMKQMVPGLEMLLYIPVASEI